MSTRPPTRRLAIASLCLVAVLSATVSFGSIATPARATGSATTTTFTDVPPSHPFYDDIAWLSSEGIASGFPDGTFRPTTGLTRQAAARWLYRLAVDPNAAPPCAASPFPDVPVGHEFCGEIAWLAEEGIADGFGDGTFRPAALVPRQAMASFLYRLAGSTNGSDPACSIPPFADVPVTHPFCGEIAWLADEGVTLVDAAAMFEPGAITARQGAAAFLHRFAALDDPVPSPGCGTSQAEPVVEEMRTIDVNGESRWYLVTVPGTHDGTTPLPLVVSFHGLSEGATIHTLMTEYSPLAEQEGFVVAFPNGTGNPVKWDASPNSNPNKDLDFVDAMLDELGTDLCIDESRVYASGLSYGAFMTSLVTCARSDRFAAVAPVAGILLPTPCSQARPVPIVTFHGTEDPILPYASFPANVDGWAGRNGCNPAPVDTQLTAEVVHRVYDCPAEADVEFYIVLGGGHAWPGSAFSRLIEPVVGYTTFDIHASHVAWEFFQQFHL